MRSLILIPALAALALAQAPPAQLKNWTKWTQVSKGWTNMNPRVAAMCRRSDAHGPNSPHLKAEFRVWVNNVGAKSLIARRFPLPEGTIVVKEKRSPGKSTDLLTVMRKRAKGFDSKLSDWEFWTADGKGKAHRKPDVRPCRSCHESQTKTDRLFLDY